MPATNSLAIGLPKDPSRCRRIPARYHNTCKWFCRATCRLRALDLGRWPHDTSARIHTHRTPRGHRHHCGFDRCCCCPPCNKPARRPVALNAAANSNRSPSPSTTMRVHSPASRRGRFACSFRPLLVSEDGRCTCSCCPTSIKRLSTINGTSPTRSPMKRMGIRRSFSRH